MGRAGFSRMELTRDFRRMGLEPRSIVIVHSSMKSIGRVAGGPSEVLRALQAVLTKGGTILMPTFTYSFEEIYGQATPFRPASSPSRTGLLTETFRRSPGVLRSRHPTHSVAAWGNRAREYVASHERLAAFDPDTPLERASRDGALVLLVGCSFSSLSLVHVAEAVAGVSYLPIFCWAHLGWRPEALVARARGEVERVRYSYAPGCSHNFGVLQREAERRGLLRHVSLGNAEVILFRAAELLDLAVERLGKEPDYLLCPPASCRACDEKRAVFEARSPGARRVTDLLVQTMNHAGIRVAGSAGERLAASSIAERMRESGLRKVRMEELSIPAWEPGYARLELRPAGSSPGSWIEVPAAPCAHAPASPARGIQGEVVQLECMAELPKLGRGAGRIAVLWDGYGSSEAELEELMSRGFGGFVYVDRRFSHAERVAVGFPARWIRHLSTPMVSVPFTEAARLFGRGKLRARLTVSGRVRKGLSCNVVGEIAGSRPGAIVVGAHHDSTFNAAAADDNLTGVAALLEIARSLARERRKPVHTLRFCSFGAEELLSEGARENALGESATPDVRFVLNNDSMGSRVGTTEIHVTGPSELASWVRRVSARSKLQFRIVEDVVPFSDHFPFNVAGAPSLWFYRTTLATGRHFHHTTHDGLGVLSAELIAEIAAFQSSLLKELAWSTRWPFEPRLPPLLQAGVDETARAWLGQEAGQRARGAVSTSRAPRRGRA